VEDFKTTEELFEGGLRGFGLHIRSFESAKDFVETEHVRLTFVQLALLFAVLEESDAGWLHAATQHDLVTFNVDVIEEVTKLHPVLVKLLGLRADIG